MKIEAYLLKNFIKKSSLNGTIPTTHLEFTEDGLLSKIKDISDTAVTETILYKDSFEEYEQIGELYIKDTIALKKYLDSFNGVITISKIEEYAVSIKDSSREIILLTGSEIVCDTKFDQDFPNIENVSKFSMDKKDMDRTYKDLSLVDSEAVLIKRNAKDVTFLVGKKEESDLFKNIVEVAESELTSMVKIGALFKPLYESLDGRFDATIERDKPLVVAEVNDKMSFKCIIAPRTDINE